MNRSEVLIETKNLRKKFCAHMRTSLWYSFYDLLEEVTCLRKGSRFLRKKEFWAVKDLSINVKRGQIVGLLGHNGAGKTTTIRLLSGIIKPDDGEIKMSGKCMSLIRLQAAFQPALTGRENIYLLGVALGYSRKFICDRMAFIIKRTGLSEETIDSSFYSYSDGMKGRLAFGIISQMKPDILFLDSVFSAGDAGFRDESFKIIKELSESAAVIVAAHNMRIVRKLCDSVIVMEKGKKIYDGSDVEKGIGFYKRFFNADG